MEEKVLGVLGAVEGKKYKYFLNKIVDTLEMWGIFCSNENAWATKSLDGNDSLILFPEKEFVEYYINKNECGGVPRKINLLEFLYEWTVALPKPFYVVLYGDNNKFYTIQKITDDIYVELNNY